MILFYWLLIPVLTVLQNHDSCFQSFPWMKQWCQMIHDHSTDKRCCRWTEPTLSTWNNVNGLSLKDLQQESSAQTCWCNINPSTLKTDNWTIRVFSHEHTTSHWVSLHLFTVIMIHIKTNIWADGLSGPTATKAAILIKEWLVRLLKTTGHFYSLACRNWTTDDRPLQWRQKYT